MVLLRVRGFNHNYDPSRARVDVDLNKHLSSHLYTTLLLTPLKFQAQNQAHHSLSIKSHISASSPIHSPSSVQLSHRPLIYPTKQHFTQSLPSTYLHSSPIFTIILIFLFIFIFCFFSSSFITLTSLSSLCTSEPNPFSSSPVNSPNQIQVYLTPYNPTHPTHIYAWPNKTIRITRLPTHQPSHQPTSNPLPTLQLNLLPTQCSYPNVQPKPSCWPTN
eukprot:TRINITY_DN8028_c0_g3_i3.p1 TRINITY_DN8028_c0_g3~~TRINITY_DN8028_c0_g3_i3.p1  ORF type:complete len:218 (-),score=8.87 TRINITY_DN8028_c0_g3_i3:1424-2077(-)